MSDMQSALTQLWVDVNENFIPDGPIGTMFPNVRFDPPDNAPWCYFYVVFGRTFVGSLGTQGTDEVNGLANMELYYPNNKGVAGIMAAFDAIREGGFKAGNYLTYNGQEVLIQRSAEVLSQPVVDEAYLTMTVRAEWYAQIQR